LAGTSRLHPGRDGDRSQEDRQRRALEDVEHGDADAGLVDHETIV
jgi:hypothetical protein